MYNRTGGLPLRSLPPSLFPSKCPLPFAQFHQVISTQPGSCLNSPDVLGAALPTRLDFSRWPTLLVTRVCPRSMPTLLASGPTLSTAALNRAVAVKTILLFCWVASPPVDTVGRLALSASTSSRIDRRHGGTSIHARTI